jgi:hypothetical protein
MAPPSTIAVLTAKAAKEEHERVPQSSRARQQNFKTESWYVVAARKLSAARTTTTDLEDVHASRRLLHRARL